MNRHLAQFLFALRVVLPLTALAQVGEMPTGTPPGVAPLKSQNSTGFPLPATKPGEPIETRTPEKADDKPFFAGQTRAPYQPTAPFKVTTRADGLDKPWSLAFLPGGNILITEKPGAMRILGRDGKLSEPVSGVPKVQAMGQVGLLDVALDPNFNRNHRLFLSFMEPVE